MNAPEPEHLQDCPTCHPVNAAALAAARQTGREEGRAEMLALAAADQCYLCARARVGAVVAATNEYGDWVHAGSEHMIRCQADHLFRAAEAAGWKGGEGK